MNSFIKTGLVAITFVIAFSFVTVDTNAQTKNQVLKTMEQHKNALQSLKATVKMEEYEGALGDSLIRNGDVVYVPKKGRDALVRIDWVKPDETLIVSDGRYILYRQKLKQAITGKVNSSKQKGANNALKFLSMSKAELDQNYMVQMLRNTTIEGTNVWHLRLTPKGPDSFVLAELWVDKNGMPIQAMVQQKNKDKTTIRLSSIKKNQTIKASTFKINLKGVKVIEG